MSDAHIELLVSSITAIIVAITGSFTAYYGFRNHALGKLNSDKLDAVQTTASGAVQALAEKQDGPLSTPSVKG